MLKVLSRAEALILRAPRAPALAAGAPVEVIPLGELGI
jgi:molybdopterin molybdotransferase